MNGFEDFCNDEITIRKKDGTLIGQMKTSFTKGAFTLFDPTLDVSEGDIVERTLPSGKVERYDVVQADFLKGVEDFPNRYKLTVAKQGSEKPDHKPTVMNNYTFTNSQGIQVGNDNTINTQNTINCFSEIIERIENSSGSPEEKKEAKSRLRAFLEHPLTAAVVGGVVSGLAGQLK